MAAKSKSKYDVYRWIRDQIIPSCKTIYQKQTARNLISNFHKQYNDQPLTSSLKLKL